MPYDTNSKLWPTRNDVFFRNRVFHPQQQHGPHCVSTALAILTGTEPSHFHGLLTAVDSRTNPASTAGTAQHDLDLVSG